MYMMYLMYPQDMYIMGSAGKSMTSTMAARVVAQGHIRWNSTTKEIFHDTVQPWALLLDVIHFPPGSV